jgi:hypothetical protein
MRDSGPSNSDRLLASTSAGFREKIMFREGQPMALTARTSAAVAVTGSTPQLICTALSTLPFGMVWFSQSVLIGLNNPGMIDLRLPVAGPPDSTGTPTFVPMYHPGGLINVPLEHLVRPYYDIAGSHRAYELRVLDTLTGGLVNYQGSVTAFGYSVTDDLDFDAPKVTMVAGDSISIGTITTRGADLWPLRFKDRLQGVGVRSRIVLKGINGSTSAQHDSLRRSGFHDISQCDLFFYALSVNDAQAGTTGPTYTARLQAFWDWFRLRYPGAKMVVLGATPLENNTWHANAEVLRAAAAAWVAGVNNPNQLAFINLATAFDRTVSANFAASDTAGQRLHPTAAAHGLIADLLWTGWQGLGWTI